MKFQNYFLKLKNVVRLPIFLAFLLFIFGLAGYLLLIRPLRQLYATAGDFYEQARAAVYLLKTQDLVGGKNELEQMAEKYSLLEKQYRRLAWLARVPVAAGYYQDGKHVLVAGRYAIDGGGILIDALLPYADVLGFKGGGSFLGGTAEDRIVLAIQTLDKVLPQIDEVQQKIGLMKKEMDQVKVERYPKEFMGIALREKLGQAVNILNETDSFFLRVSPLLKVAPSILGEDGGRKYLLLFQNDAELRATGGFITAYAVVRVERGKVTPLKSDDIYSLDNKFRQSLSAPEPILKYLKVGRFHLRDMNWNPDFKVSMDRFVKYYNQLPGEEKVDGVITVDTKVLKDLVEILGGIDVPGFGHYTADNDERCDCPQIVYELESIADKPVGTFRVNRKGVLGPMMRVILYRIYGAPKQILPQLFERGLGFLEEKHVLVYFLDRDLQAAAEAAGIAGRVKQVKGADYLMIVDSNLGGAKSNMYVEQSVEEEWHVESGGCGVRKELIISYKNSYPPSDCNLERGGLCLNGILQDWLRVYVPLGSQLVSVEGLQIQGDTDEDSNKTVFQGLLRLRPLGAAQVKLVYRLPADISCEDGAITYFLQKQAGKNFVNHKVSVGGELRLDFDLIRDVELSIDL